VNDSFPTPTLLIIKAFFAGLLNVRRSYSCDARRIIAGLPKPLHITGQENIPPAGPCLITSNHYSYPGFHSWLISSSISAVLPYDVRWVMANAFQYPGKFGERILSPLSHIVLTRLARAYNFFPMPPIPPRQRDITDRALAVRRIITAARKNNHLILGLAPEGGDTPGGQLTWPPAGVGQFISRLVETGLPILPIGVYAEDWTIHLAIGPYYSFTSPGKISKGELDRFYAKVVMCHIADLLPSYLRGVFQDEAYIQ